MGLRPVAARCATALLAATLCATVPAAALVVNGDPDDYVVATGETHSVREFVRDRTGDRTGCALDDSPGFTGASPCLQVGQLRNGKILQQGTRGGTAGRNRQRLAVFSVVEQPLPSTFDGFGRAQADGHRKRNAHSTQNDHEPG